MSFNLTRNARDKSLDVNKTPQIVLEIDGVTKVYGAVKIQKFIQYGDEGLEYGAGFVYGGLIDIEDQSPYISWSGTTSTIRQQLDVDKGSSGSISSMGVTLIDKNGEVSRELITPDETQSPAFDILGRRAKIWLGFADIAWPEDFFVVFRGTIDAVETGAGNILLKVNSPDSKKKGQIFTRATNTLNGSITAGSTVITLDDADDYLEPTFTGPDGTIDSGLEYYVRIDDEIIRYEAKTTTQLQTLTRGAFGTIAASHDDGASCESIYNISGNSIDIALKLMLSGIGGPYQEDVSITAFVRVDGTSLITNSIYFEDYDPVSKFNLSVGDYITVTGATNGANNVSSVEVVGITESLNGWYIVLDDSVTLVEETVTTALCSFRSQYDVWPEGAGMIADEVDIKEHLYIQRSFLSEAEQYDFLLRDEIELKEFLAEQVYNPVGAFSLPRKSRASVGFHLSGLLPNNTVKQMDSSNISDPSGLKIQRSTTKNFFNATVYKFDESILEEDKFEKVVTTLNTESRDRIPVGVRPLIIESKGLRTLLSGPNIATSATTRRLNKYKFGAEYIKGVKANFKIGFDLEVGDVVVFDLASLQMTDIKEGGSRSGDVRLMQIDNKSLNIKTGEVLFDLTDTNFSNDSRFGLISPASFIKAGVSTTQFIIEPSFNTTEFGINEYLKWTSFIGSEVRVRNDDFSLNDSAVLTSISGNTFTLGSALSFTPSSGMLLEFVEYGITQPQANVKLLYAFMSDSTFPDGDAQYTML